MKKVSILLSLAALTFMSCNRTPAPPPDPCDNVKHLEVVYLDGSQQYITQCLNFAVRRHSEFPDTMFVSVSDSLKVCRTAVPYINDHYNDDYITCYQGHRLAPKPNTSLTMGVGKPSVSYAVAETMRKLMRPGARIHAPRFTYSYYRVVRNSSGIRYEGSDDLKYWHIIERPELLDEDINPEQVTSNNQTGGQTAGHIYNGNTQIGNGNTQNN